MKGRTSQARRDTGSSPVASYLFSAPNQALVALFKGLRKTCQGRIAPHVARICEKYQSARSGATSEVSKARLEARRIFLERYIVPILDLTELLRCCPKASLVC